MAQDPKDNAEAYGLSKDVAADYEETEGPASGAQTGSDRTRIPEHQEDQGHGAKTRAHIKDEISRRADGGTH